MKSDVDQSYGGLVEGVHLAGYSFERAMQKLRWLLTDGRWKTAGGGYSDSEAFVASIKLDNLKMITEQRKDIVGLIKDAMPEVSNRQIAKAIGSSHTQVNDDLAGRNLPAGENKPNKNNDTKDQDGKNLPSPGFSGATGAKTVAKVEARLLKEQRREASRAENREKVAHVATANIPIDAKFPTIVIDPPWDWGDEGDQDQLGRARPDYATMTIEQLMDFNMVRDHAAADCHLYMWITNRSLPKGFALLERWDFRYVTMLTWVKPNFGMGNYFRGQTEQILFGVKGSQPLMRKDIGTAFQWPRGPNGHSSKPVEMYEMVESASPGPYLEIFSRHERPDWTSWGENSRAEAA